MRPVRFTTAAGSTSAPVPLDTRQTPFSVSVTSIPAGGATTTLQYTSDDVFAVGYTPGAGTWQTRADMTAEAATKMVELAVPVTAVRVTIGGTGSAAIQIVRAGL